MKQLRTWLLIVGIFILFAGNDLKGILDSNNRSDAIIEQTNQLMIGLLNMETAQRGNIITLNSSYLEPYIEGVSQYKECMDSLHHMLSKDKLKDIEENYKIIKETMDKTIQLISESNVFSDEEHLAARDVIKTNIGKNGMDKIRIDIDEIQFVEKENMKCASTLIWRDFTYLSLLSSGTLLIILFYSIFVPMISLLKKTYHV